VTAAATGIAAPAVFALTNLPQQSGAIVVDLATLNFTSEINQPAPPGEVVQINTSTGAITGWTATSSASWLSVSPASGVTPAQITVSVNPGGLAVGAFTGSIRITDSAGAVAVVFVTYTITDKPALVVTPHLLVFSTSSNTITPAAQTLTATSTSRTIAYRISAQVSTPAAGTWLQISTTQGQTTGSVTVTANPAGLGRGIYDGSILFTPVEIGD
jgi:Viral BACON domain